MLLDAVGGILEEGEIDDFARVFQVDEDGDALAALGGEDGGEQALEAEGGEGAGRGFGVHGESWVRVLGWRRIREKQTGCLGQYGPRVKADA